MNRSTFKSSALLLSVATLLVTQPGASCMSDTSSGGGTDTSERSSPVDSNEIPRRAAIVAEGRGNLNWTADADGQLFVQDLKHETIVVQQRVHRGDRISVLPDENRVKLNDNSISRSDLTTDHVHRIYIDRDDRFERDDRNNRDRDDRKDREGARNDNHDRLERGEVPSGADLVGRGANREVTFVAQRDGTAYVFDDESQRVIDSAHVDRGQRFTLSPGRHRATVDGKAVISDDHLDSRRNYSVYFTRD